MKNTWVSLIVAAVVFAAAGFWGGMTFAQSQRQSLAGGAGLRSGGTFVRGGLGAGQANAGAAFGTVIAKDSSSITVQLGGPDATSTNGTATGTKIVLYNPSTQVEKTVSGSPSDLSVGQSVLVTGTLNSDGSLTANNIQIRPSGGAGFRGATTISNGQ